MFPHLPPLMFAMSNILLSISPPLLKINNVSFTSNSALYELVFAKNQSLKGIQRRTLSELELKYEEFVTEHFTNPEPPALEPPTRREEKSVEKTSPKKEKTSPKKKKPAAGEKKEKIQKKEKKAVKGKVAKN